MSNRPIAIQPRCVVGYTVLSSYKDRRVGQTQLMNTLFYLLGVV